MQEFKVRHSELTTPPPSKESPFTAKYAIVGQFTGIVYALFTSLGHAERFAEILGGGHAIRDVVTTNQRKRGGEYL